MNHLKIYQKINKLFVENYFLITALIVGLFANLFIARLISLQVLAMGMPGSRTWAWHLHNPYFDQVWLVIYALLATLFVSLVLLFLKIKRLWFLSVILIACCSFFLTYIFYQKQFMEFQLAWWGNAGFAKFAKYIVANFSLQGSLQEINNWIFNQEAIIGTKSIDLVHSHISTHPLGSWLIFWPMAKFQFSYLAMGYSKVVLNLIIIILGIIALKKYFSKQTIILFSLLILLNPHLILFSTYPDTLIYALMVLVTAISIKISENNWWGTFLGLILLALMMLSFGSFFILIYILLILFFMRKQNHQIHFGIYLMFLTLALGFGIFKLFGYDYILSSFLAQINHYELMQARKFNYWFLYNIYDLLLFAGIGISAILVLVIANLKLDENQNSLVNKIALAGVVLFILVFGTGGVRGEAGRIAGFVIVPFYLLLADQIGQKAKTRGSYIFSLMIISFLLLHSGFTFFNSVYPVTEPPGHDKTIRQIYKDYPGYLPKK